MKSGEAAGQGLEGKVSSDGVHKMQVVQVRFLRRMERVGQKGEGYKWNYISSEEGREKVADQTKCWVEKAKWEGGLQYGRLLVKGEGGEEEPERPV